MNSWRGEYYANTVLMLRTTCVVTTFNKKLTVFNGGSKTGEHTAYGQRPFPVPSSLAAPSLIFLDQDSVFAVKLRCC